MRASGQLARHKIQNGRDVNHVTRLQMLAHPGTAAGAKGGRLRLPA